MSCELSAELSGATAEQRKALRQFGLAFGTAYQIYDDCVDLFGSEAAAGKSLGTDLAKGKLTLPVLLLWERADAADRARVQELVDRVAGWRPMKPMAELLAKYETLAASLEIMHQYLRAGTPVPASSAGLQWPGRTGGPDGVPGAPDGRLGVRVADQPMIMTEPASRKASHAPEGRACQDRSRLPSRRVELVKRARRGDLGAYDDLVRRYQERIYATIYHMTSNHEDANDLAQETFIKAFQALKSFKGGSSFYTWVYRIAVNKTINFLKQRKNRVADEPERPGFQRRARSGPGGADFGQDAAAGGRPGGVAGKIERGHAEAVRTP